MRETIPDSWIGQHVRVRYKASNAHGSGDDSWDIHETEGTLKDANELGLLLDDNELIAYRAVYHIQANPPKRR